MLLQTSSTTSFVVHVIYRKGNAFTSIDVNCVLAHAVYSETLNTNTTSSTDITIPALTITTISLYLQHFLALLLGVVAQFVSIVLPILKPPTPCHRIVLEALLFR